MLLIFNKLNGIVWSKGGGGEGSMMTPVICTTIAWRFYRELFGRCAHLDRLAMHVSIVEVVSKVSFGVDLLSDCNWVFIYIYVKLTRTSLPSQLKSLLSEVCQCNVKLHNTPSLFRNLEPHSLWNVNLCSFIYRNFNNSLGCRHSLSSISLLLSVWL